MLKSEVLTAAEGLTSYAVECQSGFEHRHSAPGDPPWQEQRRGLIREVLQGMAELAGGVSAKDIVERFEQRLEKSDRCFALLLPAASIQRGTVYTLRSYVDGLARTAGDHRRQLWPTAELLKDMSLHPLWGDRASGVLEARQVAEKLLPDLTTHQPLRFTRLCIGDRRGAFWLDFVSGAVLEADGVMNTDLFRRLTEQYPEAEGWPVRCQVYICNGWGAVRDADDFDLKIMRAEGEKFLERKGVRPAGEGRELELSAVPGLDMAMAM